MADWQIRLERMCHSYRRSEPDSGFVVVKCRAGHSYDGTMKSAFNAGFDIECIDFEKQN
jgi:hypothetical protein